MRKINKKTPVSNSTDTQSQHKTIRLARLPKHLTLSNCKKIVET